MLASCTQALPLLMQQIEGNKQQHDESQLKAGEPGIFRHLCDVG